MYKVIVIDDEVISRIAIMNIIDWASEGFLMLDSFENGQEALTYLQSQKVDLIITDICMPCMDGFALIEESQKIQPNIKFILLSAYDDFTYARKALHTGVSEYILKMELNKEDLLTIVRRIKSNLDDQKSINQVESDIVDIKWKKKDIREYLRKLLYGFEYYDNESVYQLIKQEAGVFYVVCFQPQIGGNVKRGNELNVLLEDMFGTESIFATWTAVDEVSILFYIENNKGMDHLAYLMNWIHQLQFVMKQYYNKNIAYFVSNIHTDMQEISQAYLEACQVLHAKNCFSEDDILTYAQLVEQREIEVKVAYQEHIRKLHIAFQQKEFLNIELEINELKNELSKPSYVDIMEIQHFISSVVVVINIFLDDIEMDREEFWGNQTSNFMESERIRRRKDAIVFLDKIRDKVKEYIIEPEGNYLVDQAKNYIKQHFTENINFVKLAQDINVSDTYLSALYKKITGQTLKNYQIELRMEKAIKLLRNTNMQIYEVAAEVGYDNEQYFSRFFKQKLGFTPSQCRNSYTEL